jgi:hypothetical protein
LRGRGGVLICISRARNNIIKIKGSYAMDTTQKFHEMVVFLDTDDQYHPRSAFLPAPFQKPCQREQEERWGYIPPDNLLLLPSHLSERPKSGSPFKVALWMV